MQFYREIDSTNRVVKEALDHGCEQGFCAAALKQTAGYGRQGRTWSSPLGGLYFSVALRPQVPVEKVPTLALLAVLAIRESLVDLELVKDPAELQIKWPNDLVLPCSDGQSFHKLCGISSEYSNGGVCVGMGLNVLRHAGVVTDGRYQPGYVSDVAGPRFEELAGFDAQGALRPEGAQVIVQRVVDTLVGYIPQWEAEDFAPFAEKYAAYSYLQGREIRIANTMDATQTEGMVCGIDAAGRLLIQTPRCEIEALTAGEVHLV